MQLWLLTKKRQAQYLSSNDFYEDARAFELEETGSWLLRLDLNTHNEKQQRQKLAITSVMSVEPVSCHQQTKSSTHSQKRSVDCTLVLHISTTLKFGVHWSVLISQPQPFPFRGIL
jgi:hypothetical protein